MWTFGVMKIFTDKERIIRLYKFELRNFVSYNCGEQSNTFSLCFTNIFMSFLFTFKGLQDITSGLKTMLYKIWCHNLDVGGILCNVHLGRGYICVIVLRPCGVCTISGWYLSHFGIHMKSIIN